MSKKPIDTGKCTTATELSIEIVRDHAERVYLEYFNNFLTIERFAEHYEISDTMALKIIAVGRDINHTRGVKV